MSDDVPITFGHASGFQGLGLERIKTLEFDCLDTYTLPISTELVTSAW